MRSFHHAHHVYVFMSKETPRLRPFLGLKQKVCLYLCNIGVWSR